MIDGIACDIPESLKDADQVLYRYGRWARDRKHFEHCGSAEWRYKIPPNDSDREPRELLVPTPDALIAHRALIRVPEPQRIVLQILYVPQRAPIQAQLRRKHIPARLCRERHLEGLRMFANIYAILRRT